MTVFTLLLACSSSGLVSEPTLDDSEDELSDFVFVSDTDTGLEEPDDEVDEVDELPWRFEGTREVQFIVTTMYGIKGSGECGCVDVPTEVTIGADGQVAFTSVCGEVQATLLTAGGVNCWTVEGTAYDREGTNVADSWTVAEYIEGTYDASSTAFSGETVIAGSAEEFPNMIDVLTSGTLTHAP